MKERCIYSYAWRQADNFGDGPLHDLLIPKLFPGILATTVGAQPCKMLMANGSILGHRHQLHPAWQNIPWIIYGSGYQYSSLDLPKKSVIYALRGRLTGNLCERFSHDIQISSKVAYSDPAILLPLYYPRDVESNSRQILTVMKWDWKGECTGSVLTARTDGDALGWLRKLWKSNRVVTDSLHAAIVADAYGIPWFPLRWEFKWQDHFSNFDITDKPRDFVLSDRNIMSNKQRDLEVAKAQLLQDHC